MKKILYTLLSLTAFNCVFAQVDSPTNYSNFFTLSASRYEPAKLGEDDDKFEVAIINANAWFANTSLDVASINKFGDHLNGNYLSRGELNTILDKMGNKTRMGAGATVEYFNMMYKFTNSDDKEIISIGFGLADRVETNLMFPNNVFNLMINGNKQYEDKTVDLSLGGSFLYSREHTLSLAMPLPISSDNWKFRVGTRLKYIKGIEALNIAKGDLSLYTAPNGEYLDFKYNYELNSSMDFRSDADNSFSPTKGKGTGYGADLGFSASLNDRFHGNINFLDIGSVTFKGDDNLTYKKQGVFRYEGIYIDDIIDESDLPVDSVLRAIESELKDGNEYVGKDFSIAYPTRMRMHLSYRIPAETSKGKTYYKHMIGFNYTQGFRNRGTAITRPYVAGSYTFNLKNIFEVGANIGAYGYNKMEFGAFIAVKAGPFRLGLGSTNITPLVRSFGTGANINFNMTLAF